MIPDRREAAIYSSWCFASVGETSMQVCFIQVLSQNIYHAYIIIYWFHLILVVNPCALPLASCRGRNPSSSPRKHQRTIRIKYLKIWRYKYLKLLVMDHHSRLYSMSVKKGSWHWGAEVRDTEKFDWKKTWEDMADQLTIPAEFETFLGWDSCWFILLKLKCEHENSRGQRPCILYLEICCLVHLI